MFTRSEFMAKYLAFCDRHYETCGEYCPVEEFFFCGDRMDLTVRCRVCGGVEHIPDTAENRTMRVLDEREARRHLTPRPSPSVH